MINLAGTVTGKSADLYFFAHSGPATTANITLGLQGSAVGDYPTATRTHTQFGVGDFSLTLDRGTVEQELVGEIGNYFDQGALAVDGSLTSVKFATSGVSDFLLNMVDALSAARYKYLAISGCVSTDTDANYLSWYLVSCQVTGYDISMGDADTITEASIDFTLMDPSEISYTGDCISDAK